MRIEIRKWMKNGKRNKEVDNEWEKKYGIRIEMRMRREIRKWMRNEKRNEEVIRKWMINE